MVAKITRLFVLLVIAGLTELSAQETVVSSGGEVSVVNGSVSYSVGQVVYTTNTGTDGSVAQGIQQPYEISVVTELEVTNNITISIYPNPTSDLLTLNIGNLRTEILSYQLFSIIGKLLQYNDVINNQTAISMANFPSGTFILKVFEGDKELKIFKIIKNN